MPPEDSEDMHTNRKNTKSLNVLAMCGADFKVFFCKSNAPGSYHDSHVLQTSSLFAYLDDPEWQPLTDGVILADSAYPQRLR